MELPELIIFDFDGTLADTTGTILETYRLTFSALGLEEKSEGACRATIGLPLREGFRVLFPSASEENLDKYVSTYRKIFSAEKERMTPQLYPGVLETLGRLRDMGTEMAIASSRSRESLIEFCGKCGISTFFSLIIGADDVERHKPDPEPVETILRRLGKESGYTAVVGDMPVDIAMGLGAGCMTIGVSYGNSSAEELECARADYVIAAFPEIITIFAASNHP